MSRFVLPQPDPVDPSQAHKVELWSLVLEDMSKRKQFGAKKYGTEHYANNGRDPLIDLYQELLDAVVYIRQCLFEKYGE